MKALHAVTLVSLPLALGACTMTPVVGPISGPEPVEGHGKDTALTMAEACRVEMIPFGLGLSAGDPIHFLVPPDAELESPLVLQDGSELETTTAHFCATSGVDPIASSPCNGLDAFSWGLDWIPAELTEEGDAWQLVEPFVAGNPGWAVLFFERGGDVFAWGWGAELDVAWPHLVDISGKANSNLVRSEFVPPESQLPVHTARDLDVERGVAIDGLDFHSWVKEIGPGWETPCFFTPPTGSADVEPRLYYSVPRPAAGTVNTGQGATVYWTEPALLPDETWIWSRPAALAGGPIPGLPSNADIDALSYFQEPNAPGEQGDGPRPGLLLFSLTEDSFDGHDGTELAIEPGEPFYAVAVMEGVTGELVYGEPRPVLTPLGRPISDVVGPRSRGVCTIDPVLFKARQADGQ